MRSVAPHDSPIAPEADIVTDIREVQVETDQIGLTIDSGTDPVFAAIAAARGTALAERGLGAAVLVERPGSPVPLLMTEAGSGVAILEAAIRARRSAVNGSTHGADVAGSVMVMDRAEQPARNERPRAGGARRARVRRPVERRRAAWSGGDAGPGAPGAADRGGTAPAGADPCADARTTADERCALADRMRLTAEQATTALRDAQRTLDEHVAQAAAAEAIADSRAQRAAKDEAQNTFRTERARAGSREIRRAGRP